MKKLINIIFSILLCSYTLCYAEIYHTGIQYDENAYILTVCGNFDGATNVIVKHKGDAISNENPPIYIRQYELHGENTISFSVGKKMIPEQYYEVYLNSDYVGEFKFVNIEERDKCVIEVLSPIAFEKELCKAVDDNNVLLGMEKGELSEDIARILIGMRPYDKSADFFNKLKAAAAMDGINKALDLAEIKKIIVENNAVLGIDLNDKFDKLNENEVEKLLYILKNEDFSSNSFKEIFDIGIAVAKYSCCEHWSNLYDVIKDNSDILNIDIEKYSDEELRKICRLLINNIGSGINSISDVKESFEKAVKDNSKNNNNSSNRVSGSVGGGSISGNNSANNNPQQGLPSSPSQSDIDKETPKFDDIQNVGWAASSIYRLRKMNVVSGTSQNTYEPERNVTRAEFSKLLALALGIDSNNYSDNQFKDVNENSYYSTYISSCAGIGVIFGDNGYFYPDNPISRQDAVVMIGRALDYLKIQYSGIKVFEDNDKISDYAMGSVSMLAANGIIDGFDDGCFHPLSNLNRAQAAVLICNMLDKTKQ